jgi:hypothetical protein
MELHEAGFVYRIRVRVEEDGEDNVVKRQMLQLWFAHREQLNVAARFCSDFLVVIDGTFNTNKERLPLLIAVGVLNSGYTFPVCFSYCPSESEESFMFVFGELRAARLTRQNRTGNEVQVSLSPTVREAIAACIFSSLERFGSRIDLQPPRWSFTELISQL